MPLPIYIATAIERAGVIGGSTLPSIMTVQDEQGRYVGKYVTKVFKQKNIKQYQPTNKEVYSYFLAAEFDLQMPSAAIIYVNKDLIEELKSNSKYNPFRAELKEGYYYGSKFLPDAKPFKTGISEKLLDATDIENIFAFDVLVRNMDRNIQKPNLIIIRKNTPILIDHDIALDIHKTFREYKALGLWDVFKGRKRHIMQNYLSRTNQQQLWAFDGFLEYLRHLNTNKLYNARDLLQNTGHSVVDFDPIVEYLNEVKRDIPSFKELLISLIR